MTAAPVPPPIAGVADRARGVMVGLAIGDAFGAPVEFDPPQAIAGRRDELRLLPGGGTFGWTPGEFTDDTQMSLVLARHLVDGPLDQVGLSEAFAAWATHAGTADVGIQTRRVLLAVRGGTHWQEAVRRLDPDAAGNGSLMRTAPVALAARTESDVRRLAREQSEVTHPNRLCVDACTVFCLALRRAVEDGELVDLATVASLSSEVEVREAVSAAAAAPAPQMSGFVLHTLTGALWAVHGAEDFEDAVWRATSLGRDADTVAAVAGALAGGLWGRTGIPDDLASRVSSAHPLFDGVDAAELEALADRLLLARG